jgi:hypothetical protein
MVKRRTRRFAIEATEVTFDILILNFFATTSARPKEKSNAKSKGREGNNSPTLIGDHGNVLLSLLPDALGRDG